MPNKDYGVIETTKWFVPAVAAQAEDAIFEVDGLGAGAGHQSASLDIGVAAVARLFEWRAFCQFATTPVLNEQVLIAIKTMGSSASATAHPDNDDGTGDSAISTRNKFDHGPHFIGSIVVNEAAANIEMVASGQIWIRARAIQVLFWNDAVDALTTDVDENGFMLTPVPAELQ